MKAREQRAGLLAAAPMLLLLALVFVAPLALVAMFASMPQRVFSLLHLPDFSSLRMLVEQGYLRSLLWSLGLAAATTAILLVICWPLAFAMARVFRRLTLIITVAVVINLLVSENIRLFGWMLTLMKGGLIEGHVRAWTGVGFDSLLFTPWTVLFGLVYVYFPFMLFPLVQGIARIPEDARQAAFDLGASRWQVLRLIDLPLAVPGIMVGSLLCFVLAAGALAEAKLLGGRSVIVIADDIETAFTYGQNWPLGSALALSLVLVVGVLAVLVISRLDIDAMMGRKQ